MTNEYNQFILDEVFNHGVVDYVNCPECGLLAKSKDYDRNDGGCLNSYHSVTCTTCNYHYCNDDWCDHCSSSYLNEAQRDFINLDLELDFFFEESDPMICLCPVTLTELKLKFLGLNCRVEGIPARTLSERMKLGVKAFLDRRFSARLEQKIASAKIEKFA
ncbi:TPA: hypothetical protein I7682_17745 [Vibrio vulnificus]|nr:hypothetical protein [Vibrio vulnificus]